MLKAIVRPGGIVLVLPVVMTVVLCVAGGDVARAAPAGGEDKALRKRARGHFEAGRKRFALRRFRSALVSFKKAYELLPLSGFLFNLGQCYRFLGDCKMAVFYYSGFVRANPGTPDSLFVSKLLERCKARLAGERARRTEANRLYAAGRTALSLARFHEAIVKITAAYRKVPLPGYLYHLGEAHRAQKLYDKAVHFYREYLRHNPGSPQARIVRKRITECKRLHSARIRKNLGLGATKRPGAVSKPVYKRWWFWTSVAVAVVATAVGLGVGLGVPPAQKLPQGSLESIDWTGLPQTGGVQ
jgi:tetratricopeptide (TPR) repeat protein